MKKNNISALISLVLTYIFSLTVVVLCFFMPTVVERLLPEYRLTVLVTYYVCVPAVLLAMYLLAKLLGSVRKMQMFTMTNVLRMRVLSWCCGYFAIATCISGIFYLPMLIAGFFALFVCIILRVVKNMMASAVEIQKENDLTI